MKASRKLIAAFLYSFFFLLIFSCNTEKAEKKAEAINMSPYEMASSEYVEIADQALKAWANQDFDAYGTLLAEDVHGYSPGIPHESGNAMLGIEQQVKQYKSWTSNSDVENIEFSDLSIIAVEPQNNTVFYKDAGISVLAYATMKMTIFGKPTNNGISWIFHFDEDKLIDKIYLFYDQHQQFDAMN